MGVVELFVIATRLALQLVQHIRNWKRKTWSAIASISASGEREFE